MDLIREVEAKAASVSAQAPGEAPEKAPEKAPAKKAPARKAPRVVRTTSAGGGGREKAVWGVFDSSFKRVALFEWRDRALADRKAEELGRQGGSAYVVRQARVPMKD